MAVRCFDPEHTAGSPVITEDHTDGDISLKIGRPGDRRDMAGRLTRAVSQGPVGIDCGHSGAVYGQGEDLPAGILLVDQCSMSDTAGRCIKVTIFAETGLKGRVFYGYVAAIG